MKHNLCVAIQNGWEHKFINATYGDYMSCIRASPENPTFTYGTGMLGLVSTSKI
ncbi:MAG: hypothetical protein ACPLYF_02165 [Fervidobacterium sp.]